MTKKIFFLFPWSSKHILVRIFSFLIISSLFIVWPQMTYAKWVYVDKNNQNNSLTTQKLTSIGVINGFDLEKINYKDKEFFNLKFWDNSKEAISTSEVGLPKLPVISRIVEFNKDTKELSIEFTGTNQNFSLKKEGAIPIFPIQPSTPKILGAFEKQNLILDEKFYTLNELYPRKDYEIKSTFQVRGHQFALIHFYPVKYNPAKNLLQIKKNFKITINNNNKLSKRKDLDQIDNSEIFQQFFADLGVKSSMIPLRTESNFRDTMLIIAGDAFASDPLVAKYVEVKKSLGFQVIFKKMSEIGTGAGATDIAVRNYVKNIYNATNPRLAYIMIIGDVNHVPTHQGKSSASSFVDSQDIKNDGNNDEFFSRGQVTDYFYGAIDKATYEEDLGGPDIFVGRLSINTINELQIVMNKLLRYNTVQFDDLAWTKKSSFLATDDRYEIAEGTHNFVMSSYTTKTPWEHMGNFPVANQSGGDKLYAITHHANTQNLINMFREGRTLINYSGHGANTYWAGPTFKQADLVKIDHEDAMPLVISNACITNTFAMQGDCFGEMWIKHPYGAIAFWGASNNSYWDEDDILERTFYKTLFESENKTLGNATVQGLMGVWRAYGGSGSSSYYTEIYNLLGDPSLELLMDTPKVLSVTHPQEFLFGTGAFEVNVQTADQGPAKMAHVTLIGPNLQKTFQTNSSGIAQIALQTEDVNVGDHLSLYVHAFGQIPYQADILVLANSHSYLAHASHEILGDTQHLQVGTSGEMALKFKNIGTIDSGDVKATVKTDNPFVIIKQKNIHFTNIPAGSEGEAIESITYEIRKGIPDQTPVVFTLEWESENGANKGKTTFKELVFASQLSLVSSSVIDVSGNNNGKLDPGEEGEVTLKIKNTGHMSLLASDSNFSMVAKTQGIEVLTPTLSLDKDIAMNEEFNIHFKVRVGGESIISNGTIAKYTIMSQYQGLNKNFEVEHLIGSLVSQNLESAGPFPMDIPDNNASGISAIIDNANNFKLDAIKVRVKITHTYVGDLEIILITPSGKQIKLHSKSGGSQDNIDCIYGETCQSAEALTVLKGENAKGTFTLKVTDRAGSDKGSLDAFGLSISGYAQN